MDKDLEKDKCICKECGWRGNINHVLSAENPFDKTEEITGCPKCKSIDSIISVCDHKGCWYPVSCGTPSKNGYRQTCGRHVPKESNG